MENFPRSGLLAIVLACTCLSAAAQSKCNGTGTWTTSGQGTSITGEYCNVDYAYAVQLPKGWIAWGSTPPAPNHGFGINPANPASTLHADMNSIPYLWVDASYDAQDLNNLHDATNFHVQISCHEGVKTILGRTPVRLDGQPAEYVRLSCLDGVMEEFVVTYRQERSIVYSIELITTASRLEQDHVVFQDIVASFRLTDLPRP